MRWVYRGVWVSLGLLMPCFYGAAALADERASQKGLELSVFRVEDDAGMSALQHHYRVTLRVALAQFQSADVLTDPRLFWFELEATASSRKMRCMHPRAPRRQPGSKLLRSLSVRHPQDPDAWQTDVDLRMYCKGSALKALAKGGLLIPHYGRRVRRGKRFVARATDRSEDRIAQVTGAPLMLDSEPKIAGSGPAILSMTRVERRVGTPVIFSTRLRAKHDASYVYVRPDQYRFLVSAPDKTVECRMERLNVTPIRDFFRKITPRRAIRHRLEAGAFCPGLLTEPGIYEVVPELDLIHDGADNDLDALTGVVRGEPTIVKLY
ncbi:MAG: hypothetical protein H6715_04295 [Myxococcales bacterium]|nr:hypothetical protein [Myxococcales bacterium]MCB9708790.1 hypothetical protein [Myxococcales bacterium]